MESLNATLVDEEARSLFQQFKVCNETESSSRLHFKNIKGAEFRYLFSHENNMPLDRSKVVCTKDDLAKLMESVTKTDVIESCSKDEHKMKFARS